MMVTSLFVKCSERYSRVTAVCTRDTHCTHIVIIELPISHIVIVIIVQRMLYRRGGHVVSRLACTVGAGSRKIVVVDRDDAIDVLYSMGNSTVFVIFFCQNFEIR